MIIPQINMNGDTKESLLREVAEAYRAVDAALEKVAAITVHGRNFQTLPDGRERLQQAIVEHESRYIRLNNVLDELRELHNGIAEQ